MATGREGGGLNLSDESFDVRCTTCSKKKINKQASVYCTDCNKNLCDKCIQIHDEYVDVHKLVDVNDADQANVLTEKCDKHKEEVINLFCADHDDVVCSICGLLEHRKCNDLKHITDCVEEVGKDSPNESSRGQLKSGLQDVEEVIAALDRHLEELTEHEQKLLDKIEEYTTKILAKVKTIKRKAEKEVTTKYEQLSLSVSEKRQTCMTMKDEINQNLQSTKSSRRRKLNLFVLEKRGQVLAKNVETLCLESDMLMKGSRLAFRHDTRLEACLNDVTSLGTVDEKYKATLKDSVDVSVAGDINKSPDVVSCCVLHDGTVLFLDNRNKRLKRLNSSVGTVKDHCNLEGYGGICSISPHEVAVCTGSPELHVVSTSTDTKLRHKSKLRMIGNCRRMLKTGAELFVADTNTVYVHELTGKLKRTICKDASGQNMFLNITGLAVDSTGDLVYVANVRRGLVCVDKEGRERFRVPEKKLGMSGLTGVCTDIAGNMFVCGFHSNNVIQVSMKDGRVLGEILSDTHGIEKPRCLCFDPNSYKLYVGGCTSKFLVFQLE